MSKTQWRSRTLENGDVLSVGMDRQGWDFCDAQDEKRAGPKPEKRCMTCRFSNDVVEIHGELHTFCNHPDWRVRSWPLGWAKSERDVGGWDVLRDEWDTCEHHQPRTVA